MSVYQRTVFLEPDFEVGPGPAFHVYLVPQANIRDAAAVTDKMYVDLGQLRAFKGEPALSGAGRHRSEELSERGDLVRALRRLDLAGGS